MAGTKKPAKLATDKKDPVVVTLTARRCDCGCETRLPVNKILVVKRISIDEHGKCRSRTLRFLRGHENRAAA